MFFSIAGQGGVHFLRPSVDSALKVEEVLVPLLLEKQQGLGAADAGLAVDDDLLLATLVSSKGTKGRISRITPSESRKATSKGMEVFFIQKKACLGSSKTKIMPRSGGRNSRFIRPTTCSLGVSATSTVSLWSPILSLASPPAEPPTVQTASTSAKKEAFFNSGAGRDPLPRTKHRYRP